MCYVLRCEHPTRRLTYIGSTNSVCRRGRQHNGEIKGGARYTTSLAAQGFLWTPILIVRCPTLRAARQVEKHAKIMRFKSLAKRWTSESWRTRSGQKVHLAVRKVLAALTLNKFKGAGEFQIVWFDESWAPAHETQKREHVRGLLEKALDPSLRTCVPNVIQLILWMVQMDYRYVPSRVQVYQAVPSDLRMGNLTRACQERDVQQRLRARCLAKERQVKPTKIRPPGKRKRSS